LDEIVGRVPIARQQDGRPEQRGGPSCHELPEF
jgi:hypothetical protein